MAEEGSLGQACALGDLRDGGVLEPARRVELQGRLMKPAPTARLPSSQLALLTWAGAYAVITLILAVLGPAMAPWPLPLRTLLLSVLMVVAMTWLVIPSLTRLFQRWLTPGSPRSVRPAPCDRQ
jgi:antibiotic biosynthesis monooxygenase (ABM) superfamily enzyme